MFAKAQRADCNRDPRLKGAEIEKTFSRTPMLSSDLEKPPSTNIFSSTQPCLFGQSSGRSSAFGQSLRTSDIITSANIFVSPDNSSQKNTIFNSQRFTFGNQSQNIFAELSQPKFALSPFVEKEPTKPLTIFGGSALQSVEKSVEPGNFQRKSNGIFGSIQMPIKEKQDVEGAKKERLDETESQRLQSEQKRGDEESKKTREKEMLAQEERHRLDEIKILQQKERSERERKEAARKDKERLEEQRREMELKEAEEKRRLEAARREREEMEERERKRQEKIEQMRQAENDRLAELKRQEEMRLRSEAAYR